MRIQSFEKGLQGGPGLVHSQRNLVRCQRQTMRPQLVLLDPVCWHHLVTVNSAGSKGCDCQHSLCSIWVLISFPGGSDGKEYACNVGDLGLIPELGRSPGGGHGNPLQYPCLENPTDRGAWQAIVQGLAKSQIQLKHLSTHTCILFFVLELFLN